MELGQPKLGHRFTLQAASVGGVEQRVLFRIESMLNLCPA
jgi:hypothetical protein